MRALLLGAGLALAATLAGCAPDAPSSQPTPTVTAAPVAVAASGGDNAILAEARQFVFRARNDACLSTGTAFAFDRTVVTNRHVAAGTSSLQLATWSGTDFSASVAGHSGSVDLARLAAAWPGGTVPPPAGVSSPPVGSVVYVTGYPQGDQLTVTSGTVTGITTAPDLGVSGPILQISDQVKPGNSGSPLLDETGRVVGVVFALDSDTGAGLAMPLATLQSFLNGPTRSGALPCTS